MGAKFDSTTIHCDSEWLYKPDGDLVGRGREHQWNRRRDGLYSAPTLVPNPSTATVTATSTAAAVPGSPFVTVAAPTVIGTSQITVTATPVGGATQSDVVTLIVR